MLFSAMVDVALDRGIERYTGVIPDPFRRELLSLGWQAEPLGPAVRIEGGPIGAFLLHVRPDTPARLGCTGVYSTVLYRSEERRVGKGVVGYGSSGWVAHNINKQQH